MGADVSGTGYGPDDMGDDEQDTEVAEYEEYIEDPPDDLVIAEDADDDAEKAEDWAARHPKAATRPEEPDDESAEQAAIRETRER
ncbi:MAG TPA: hypothetical protein VK817_08425 [Trebonia sp.]|jgi:hypothetical protein|nr:hypothetical protein [Trebonia sp.]